MNSPTNAMPNPSETQNLGQVLQGLPSLPNSGSPEKAAPSHNRTLKSSNFKLYLIAGGITLAGIVAVIAVASNSGTKANRPDLLLHTVKLENLDLTVVERGTLESADNKDVICQVKATKGANTAATTIKWVVDDGTQVKQGQLIAILDSAALEDEYKAQKIVVDQAYALKITAEQNLEIVRSQNNSDIKTAESTIKLAEIDLEKYTGLPKGTLAGLPPQQAHSMLQEMEHGVDVYLRKYQDQFNKNSLLFQLKGEYQQALDDVTGRIELAEADLEMWKDRAAYSRRMQFKGYLSASQVQADESRLASAQEALKKVSTEKDLLKRFTADRMVKDLSTKLQEAWRAFERVKVQARAKEITAQTDYDKNKSVYEQELHKLEEVDDQIKACKIHAPQDGMVVYFIPEQARFGSGSSQSIIAQGEPVKEGQKLMRIPDLRRMQVMTKVHEAMVSRIQGDDRRSTGFFETLRATLFVNPNAMARLLNHHEAVMEEYHDQFRDKEYVLASEGQNATIRIDAFADRRLKGHVRTVATVNSQQDWMSADVKVYQTVVAIDESLPGLKPGMSAEVTIHVENTVESVPCIPVQSVIGGAESGRTRTCYVMTDRGPVEKQIVIGLANDKMAEIKEGLEVGDQVIINPKVLFGDKLKTFEPQSKGGEWKGKGGKGGEGKGGDGKFKMKGKGGAEMPPGQFGGNGVGAKSTAGQ